MKKLFPLLIVIFLFSASACYEYPTTPTLQAQPTASLVFPTATATTTEPTAVLFSGCVGNQSLRVRQGPGTQFDIIGGLPAKTCVSVSGRNQDSSWVWISFERVNGWVFSEYLSVDGNVMQLPVIDNNGKVFTGNQPTQVTTTKSALIPPTTTPLKTNTPQTRQTENIILCKDTGYKAGSIVTCKIPRAHCSYQPSTSGSPTFCNDAPYPSHDFTLLVWEQDWSRFDGSCLIVSGRVNYYKGKLQIEATGKSQVSYCP